MCARIVAKAKKRKGREESGEVSHKEKRGGDVSYKSQRSGEVSHKEKRSGKVSHKGQRSGKVSHKEKGSGDVSYKYGVRTHTAGLSVDTLRESRVRTRL